VSSRATDAELIARCLQGPPGLEGAFHGLYARHAAAALGFLTGLVGAAHAADCLQETFLLALRSLHRHRADRPFRPWLLGVARNVALHHHRRQGRRPGHDAPAPGVVVDPAAGAPEQAERREEVARLRTAVATLPEPERAVYVLRVGQGLTFAEVAEALGCSLRTAKYRMRSAVDRLTEALRGEEP